MSEPYTPGTADVRAVYAESQEHADFPTQEFYEEWHRTGAGEGEFDRWLTAHDESVRAEARAEDGSKLAEQYNAELVRRTKAEAERDELAAVIEKVHEVIHTPATAWRA